MNTMNHIDQAILRCVLKQLDKAAEHLKAGGPVNEVMAALSITWAKTDIEVVLNTQDIA